MRLQLSYFIPKILGHEAVPFPVSGGFQAMMKETPRGIHCLPSPLDLASSFGAAAPGLPTGLRGWKTGSCPDGGRLSLGCPERVLHPEIRRTGGLLSCFLSEFISRPRGRRSPGTLEREGHIHKPLPEGTINT